MLKIQLTEKNLKFLQIMIDDEIRANENYLSKIKEEGYKGYFNMAMMLETRNKTLKEIQERLYNTID